ncbi:glutamate-5-semialdehyde dehydrogenase [Parvularcula sp. ZS-1/3]|uniref:Gamma-glutamyl phosphate reductase n=1 Tax=Parvularcula mediterranea TaxID=2732508 RepID=A0A7Y3RP40_9PROT|nr:glutamate-5-semialdehyde dehydrogenase [Parvularcula mediterranea]NNU17653.1 glutamate-5-semialdehyde dehydrogenase [Parvularcula mediterranea]
MLDAAETGVRAEVRELCLRARDGARGLAKASEEAKDLALREAAKALRARTEELVASNAKDVEGVKAAGKPDSFIDRLMLDAERIDGIAAALEQIADLPHPVGRKLATFERPNGLVIDRVAVPIGVIGMIYESRPNVGADAGGLCLKSGNAVILRGGSESTHSTEIIVSCMQEGLKKAGLPIEAVQKVPTTDRAAVAALLQAVGLVDLVIPRGGKGLVSLVRDQARVPTLLHLDGNCHTYIHEKADAEKAAAIVANAKLRRTGICGATESLVIDQAALPMLPKIVDALEGCELRGDAEARAADSRIGEATEDDWGTEYLDSVLSIKTVDGLDEAIRHVSGYSSHHTDAIVTEDQAAAERFLTEIDSAVVMHNASTQFSDGGEFGMGAEIGIATGKIHARGPVGLEQLTTFKYTVRGEGQTRT